MRWICCSRILFAALALLILAVYSLGPSITGSSTTTNPAEEYAKERCLEERVVEILAYLGFDGQLDAKEKEFIDLMEFFGSDQQYQLALQFAIDGTITDRDLQELYKRVLGTQQILFLSSDLTLSSSLNQTVVLTADNITLDCNGYSVKSSGRDGIFVSERDGVVIKNCIVNNFSRYGIHLYRNTNAVVTGNITNGNRYYGIRLNGSSHNVVTHNIANSNRIAGISLTIVSNNTIADNVTDSNGWIGIYSVDSWENIIRDNVARNNKEGMFASGIWIISDLTVSRDNIVTGNTLLNNKNGLLLIKTHGDRVESNLIRKSTESGVVSILTEEISLVDNLVTDNGDPSLPFVPITPVEFSGRLTSDDPTDSWTLFLPKDAVVYAIAETDTLGTLDIQKVVDSSGREIPGRWRGGQLSIKEFRVPQDDNYTFTVTLMHGTPDQVHLCWREEWTDSDYVLKILSANQAEIDLIEVEGHEILANEIHDSAKDGIRLFESENNVLEENSITGNRENGLYLYGSPMNRVWHNNIYDNNRAGGTYYNAFSDQPIELFYNQEGNYWGHTTPPCFWVYGGANMPYDSNRGDVVDSYPYCEESGWAR